MKIAAFYENIKEGRIALGLSEEEALKRALDAGMEKIYIGYENLKNNKEDLLPLFSRLGIGVEGLHAFFRFGVEPEDESYRDVIDLAKDAGAGNVLLVPGMIREDISLSFEIQREHMAKAMRKAVAYGKEKGIDVGMEDFDGKAAPFSSIDGLNWFIQKIDGLSCCFDTGNFVVYEEDPLLAFDTFREKITVVHIKDRARVPLHPDDRPFLTEKGTKFYPAPAGQGVMPILETVQKLKEDGYSGALVAELYGCTPEYMLDGILDSVRWLKKITA